MSRSFEKCGRLWKAARLHNVDNIQQKDIQFIFNLFFLLVHMNHLLSSYIPGTNWVSEFLYPWVIIFTLDTDISKQGSGLCSIPFFSGIKEKKLLWRYSSYSPSENRQPLRLPEVRQGRSTGGAGESRQAGRAECTYLLPLFRHSHCNL